MRMNDLTSSSLRPFCGRPDSGERSSRLSAFWRSSAIAAGPAARIRLNRSAQASRPGWEHFAAQGWNCRQPSAGVTVCSPPGQALPVVAIPPAQPPADRPPTVTLKRWINGVFNANVLLKRPEIYNGQPCESTGAPYTFITVLGYFECAHLAGS